MAWSKAGIKAHHSKNFWHRTSTSFEAGWLRASAFIWIMTWELKKYPFLKGCKMPM